MILLSKILNLVMCLLIVNSVLHAQHSDPEGLLRLDIMSLVLKGDRQTAIIKITQFLSDNPDHPKQAEFLARRGVLRVDSGDKVGGIDDIKKAIPLLDSQIAADPRKDGLIFVRAQARQASNDREGALVDFRRALELKPGSGEYKLGLMLAEKKK